MDSPYVVRTLVVEDDSFWQETILRKLQEQRSLQVIAIAADGLEAVRNTEELQPDLVLLDVGLPRLNGMEVAKRTFSSAEQLPSTRTALECSQSSTPAP